MDALNGWLNRRLQKTTLQQNKAALDAVSVFIQWVHRHVSHFLSRKQLIRNAQTWYTIHRVEAQRLSSSWAESARNRLESQSTFVCKLSGHGLMSDVSHSGLTTSNKNSVYSQLFCPASRHDCFVARLWWRSYTRLHFHSEGFTWTLAHDCTHIFKEWERTFLSSWKGSVTTTCVMICIILILKRKLGRCKATAFWPLYQIWVRRLILFIATRWLNFESTFEAWAASITGPRLLPSGVISWIFIWISKITCGTVLCLRR